MSWQQLSVTTQKSSVEALSDLISELGAVSVTYLDAEDHPVYEPKPGETLIWDQTRIVGLFSLDCDLDLIQSVICKQFNYIPLQNWQIERLKEQIWERAWMDHYQPMKFGNKLWVCPTEQEINEPGSTCLTLDPGLAFGTGTHPTTAMCLEWLAEQPVNQLDIIDYGCGSGILAIAGLLLGARHAYGIDIDPQAITATQANAEKNKVSAKLDCLLPDGKINFQADIVVANILAKPLVSLAPEIIALIKPGGRLVLSGILNEQTDSVLQSYQSEIEFNPPMIDGDWVRLDGISKTF